MKTHYAALLCLLFLAFCQAGCKSYSPSSYISPRVTGRVLDQTTRQPIKHVEVRRVTANEAYFVEKTAKGSQALNQSPGVRTGADGTFVLKSVRNLSFLLETGWYSVSVSFARAGYRPLTTNYTLANSTNTAKGEPWVNAGDILLVPSGK
jgi:hypothetical protein